MEIACRQRPANRSPVRHPVARSVMVISQSQPASFDSASWHRDCHAHFGERKRGRENFVWNFNGPDCRRLVLTSSINAASRSPEPGPNRGRGLGFRRTYGEEGIKEAKQNLLGREPQRGLAGALLGQLMRTRRGQGRQRFRAKAEGSGERGSRSDEAVRISGVPSSARLATPEAY